MIYIHEGPLVVTPSSRWNWFSTPLGKWLCGCGGFAKKIEDIDGPCRYVLD
jgi:hypothetical protein